MKADSQCTHLFIPQTSCRCFTLLERSSIKISTNPAVTKPRAKMTARGLTRKPALLLGKEKIKYKPRGLPSVSQNTKAVAAGQLGVAGQLQVLHYTDEAQTGCSLHQ